MKAIALGALIAISIAPTPVLTVVWVPHGAYTGLEYRQRTEDERSYYLAGLWDGLLAAPLFGADEKLSESFHQCLLQFKTAQLLAIVDKHLADHPVQWQQDMQALALSALRESCPAFEADNKKFWGAKKLENPSK